jgi:hypothetical protein
MLRELPLFSLSTDGLVLNAALNTPIDSQVTFDFGDGTGLFDSAALPHTYARPGRYEVLVRIAANGRMTAAVVVSRQHSLQPPMHCLPNIANGRRRQQGQIAAFDPDAHRRVARCDLEHRGKKPDSGSGPVRFTLDPGRYVLRFSARRSLTVRFYSRQRNTPAPPLAFDGLRLATNRTFDVTTGTESTASLNTFGQHVFGGVTPSPSDRWTLELPLEENSSLVSISSTDAKQYDMSELTDVFLALEYIVRDE